MEIDKKNIIILTGHTASGKSKIGLELLDKLEESVIINIDSMQVYKNNKLLSAQPDYEKDHLLYGFLDDSARFSVFEMLNLIKNKTENENFKNFVIIGGSPLYIRLFIDGIENQEQIDKELEQKVEKEYENNRELIYKELENYYDKGIRAKISINDKLRVIKTVSKFRQTENKKDLNKINFIGEGFNLFKFLLYKERDLLYKNAEKRFKEMIDCGAVDEVENFIKIYENYDYINFQSFKTIGFREIWLYLASQLKYNEMINLSVQKTRNYIKHQDTWYRNKFKDFIKIEDSDSIINQVRM